VTFRQFFAYRADGLPDSSYVTGPVTLLSRRVGYDSALALDSIRLAGNGWTGIGSNSDGMMASIAFPDGNAIQPGAYLENHQMTRLYSSVPGALDDSYRVDSLGRITERLNFDGWRQWGFDRRGRLGGVAYGSVGEPCLDQYSPGGYTYDCWYNPTSYDSGQAFLYDAVGNRTDSDGAYGAGNRITAFGGIAYHTDGDGNVDSIGARRLFWSGDGRLDSTRAAGGAAIAYRYDAAGRLVRRDSSGAVVSLFLWQGDQLLAELSGNGGELRAQYSYYGMDNLHALYRPSYGVAYAQRDGLGNVRHLAGTLATQREYEYDPWGNPAGGADYQDFNGVDRARWKGALSFEGDAGLYYMRNRWYEPRTGRFLSEDPIGFGSGLNLYAFAGGDPINRADPSGLEWQEQCWHVTFTDQYGRQIGMGEIWCTAYDDGRWPSGLPHPQGWEHNSCDGPPGNRMAECDDHLTNQPRELAPTRESCGAKWLAAAGTVAVDALFFTGVGAAARLGHTSMLLAGTARNIARQGGWQAVGRLTWQGSLITREAASATRLATVASATGALGYGYAGAVQVLSGGVNQSFVGRVADFIPGIASFKAIGEAAMCQWGR
jgi:RHS repeat-associated protein